MNISERFEKFTADFAKKVRASKGDTMNINDFNKPTEHPYGMCSGYEQANEKEGTLTFILSQCLDAGDIHAEIETRYSHAAMVDDGLLEQVGQGSRYKLTRKSIGLLYAYYGKETR